LIRYRIEKGNLTKDATGDITLDDVESISELLTWINDVFTAYY